MGKVIVLLCILVHLVIEAAGVAPVRNEAGKSPNSVQLTQDSDGELDLLIQPPESDQATTIEAGGEDDTDDDDGVENPEKRGVNREPFRLGKRMNREPFRLGKRKTREPFRLGKRARWQPRLGKKSYWDDS